MSDPISIGIIGGSGLYDLPALKVTGKVAVDTPFGKPSGDYIRGTVDGVAVVFLARHGQGHVLNPSEVNYRANVYGMKQLGVERLIAVSAVGSLKEEIKPGTLVFIDQFIDRTKSVRPATFFENGLVAHVSFADPICSELSRRLCEAAQAENINFVQGGTYVCIEGPAFSTRAESHLHRAWGASVVGMTNLTEARLAREAQICYATIAIATDYDCWREGDDVDLNELIRVLCEGSASAKKIISRALPGLLQAGGTCRCRKSLATAVFTQPECRAQQVQSKLQILFR